jgi:Na+/H+ antiporter
VNRAPAGNLTGVRSVETVVVLVALATVVAAFAGRLRVPAPSLLVVAGLVAGLLPGVPQVHVPPAMVSLVVLPPLLYAASEELPWRDVQAVWRPVVALAVGLVAASAAAVAAVAVVVAGLPVGLAFVLGAVLASTDPVAVSALSRRIWLPSRIQALVQAESLFNDGTSLVLFQVAVSAVTGAAAGTVAGTLWHGAGQFVLLAGGGVLAGAVVAAGAMLLRHRITDPVLETVAALLTPYVAYLLGAALHVSGVTAVIVAGLVIGARRERITTAQTRLQLHSVYQTVIFVLESAVFSLIGLELPTLVRDLGTGGPWPVAALAVTGTLMAVRIAWVFPLSALYRRRTGPRGPAWPAAAVISWAGARGVVPLAAALSIPLTTDSGAPLPHRDLVLVLATAAIVISLVVQGFTLEPLARLAGYGPGGRPGHEETIARLRLAEAGLARLDELAGQDAAPDAVIDRLRAGLQAAIGSSRADLDPDNQEAGDQDREMPTEHQIRRELTAAENAELARLFEDGTITAATRQRLQRGLDLEIARLAETEPQP